MRLWVIAVLSFGVGDVVTTGIGLGVPGVTEVGPVVASYVGWHPFAAIVGVKLVVFGGALLLWMSVPRPHRVGVPLGLFLVGTVVTVWNASVLIVSLAL